MMFPSNPLLFLPMTLVALTETPRNSSRVQSLGSIWRECCCTLVKTVGCRNLPPCPLGWLNPGKLGLFDQLGDRLEQDSLGGVISELEGSGLRPYMILPVSSYALRIPWCRSHCSGKSGKPRVVDEVDQPVPVGGDDLEPVFVIPELGGVLQVGGPFLCVDGLLDAGEEVQEGVLVHQGVRHEALHTGLSVSTFTRFIIGRAAVLALYSNSMGSSGSSAN